MTDRDRTTRQVGTDRALFMARVRAALGHAGSHEAPVPPVVDEELVRLAGPDDDLLELFTRRAEEVGMTVHRTTQAQWPQQVAAQLAQAGARSAALGFKDRDRPDALSPFLVRAGVDILDWRHEGGVDAQFEVDAGVTDVHAALAETGTLICCSDAQHSRCLSLVPPLHVAVVRRSEVLPDMIDYWRSVEAESGGALSSSISFITGPSKTADIEGELITGVHGPEKVEIYLVEDE